MRSIGALLFSYRSLTPLPLVAVALLYASPYRNGLFCGAVLMAIGEVIRLVSVNHIGPQSRRRTEQVGSFCQSGPYAWVRNPLYIGNLFLWTGFFIGCGNPWTLFGILLIALQYLMIVPWEEKRLLDTLGEPYRQYTLNVSRWIPIPPTGPFVLPSGTGVPLFSLLKQEKSTITAILILKGLLVLIFWIK